MAITRILFNNSRCSGIKVRLNDTGYRVSLFSLTFKDSEAWAHRKLKRPGRLNGGPAFYKEPESPGSLSYIIFHIRVKT
ncbi:MAG: hypothetical protein A3F83_11625 [Candidatus Glassbacteria bacterium RIFCSPLOWO2_12_FULL_58_11]|uniref:Uncharacterized protein n=1 Tax=Candidatus Glassbacteria bacterium RIFCSPLOWO2_12_FULL_58_11 TaxID=1817867 RepID=A0A1F5Z0N6_9BACT|nr:MAG: hypothetical protein A3F83_11625 [Candidatus Glassbacteria bacterium RIFCSPLOWO2_12_FULL_58_11]